MLLSVAHKLIHGAELPQILLRVLFRPVIFCNSQGVLGSRAPSAECFGEPLSEPASPRSLNGVYSRKSAAVYIIGDPEIPIRRALFAAVEFLYHLLQAVFIQFTQLSHLTHFPSVP